MEVRCSAYKERIVPYVTQQFRGDIRGWRRCVEVDNLDHRQVWTPPDQCIHECHRSGRFPVEIDAIAVFDVRNRLGCTDGGR